MSTPVVTDVMFAAMLAHAETAAVEISKAMGELLTNGKNYDATVESALLVEEKVEKLEETIETLNSAIGTKDKQITDLTTERDNLVSARDKLVDDLKKANEKITSLGGDLSESNRKNTTLVGDITKRDKEIDALKENATKMMEASKLLTKQVGELTAKLESKTEFYGKNIDEFEKQLKQINSGGVDLSNVREDLQSFLGLVFNCDGAIPMTPTGTLATPTGTLATPTGTLATPTGTLATPTGTLATPTGTLATLTSTPAVPEVRVVVYNLSEPSEEAKKIVAGNSDAEEIIKKFRAVGWKAGWTSELRVNVPRTIVNNGVTYKVTFIKGQTL